MKSLNPTFLILCLLSVSSFGQSTHFVVNSNDSGTGSLRQIIEDSNSGDTIKFLSQITEVNLTSGELVIDKSLSILADTNITIARTSNYFRIMLVSGSNSIHLSLKNITIANGLIYDENSEKHGGGILANSDCSTLTLHNCKIENNMARNGQGSSDGGSGGGIYGKYVELFNCIFDHNLSGDGGSTIGPPEPGGDGGSGGGLYCDSTLIVNCLFLNNESGNGGSSYGVEGGWAGNGGGVYIKYSGRITNSTICYNIAQYGGGGNASGKPGDGGGVYKWNSGNVLIDNCIITDNIAHWEGNDLFGSYYANNNLVMDIENCELNGNNNIIGNSPEFIDPPADLSISNISPAINAGNTDTSGLLLPNYDLMYNPRINGDTIDMGAYEYQFTVSIEDIDNISFIKIFPNPSSGQLWINNPNSKEDFISVEIFNSFGKKLMESETSENLILVDMSEKPKGVYLIRIKSGSDIFSEKIIVQ